MANKSPKSDARNRAPCDGWCADKEKPRLIGISAGIYDMRLDIDARQLPLHSRQVKHMMAAFLGRRE